MKFFTISLTVSLLLFASAFAHAQTLSSPLLWKVQRGDSAGYIFGLNDMIDFDDLPIGLTNYLDKSELLVLQSTGGSEYMPIGMPLKAISNEILYSGRFRLTQYLSMESFEKLVQTVQQVSQFGSNPLLEVFTTEYLKNKQHFENQSRQPLGEQPDESIDPDNPKGSMNEKTKQDIIRTWVSVLKPWYAITFLNSQIKMEQGLNWTGPLNLAIRIWKYHVENENLDGQARYMGFLEEPRTTRSAWESVLTPSYLEARLREVSSGSELIAKHTKYLQDVHNCYRASDIPCLTRLAGTEGGMATDLEVQVTKQRNEDWIQPIEAALEFKPTFIAIDISHLLGEENLLSLLEERGFSVERVKF